MNLVGKQFPNIDVPSINNKGEEKSLNIRQLAIDNNTKILLFWYPKDFTFVCPTEIHAFQNKLEEFQKRNTLIIGASCDTKEVHFAWLNTPKNQGGIEGVTFDLLSDTNRNLSSTLDILDATTQDDFSGLMDGENVTYRATYLIDESGEVFHQGINHMPLGRNVDEYLRLIDAYTHVQENGEVCPANWQEGSTAMTADRTGVANYLSNH